MHVKAFGVMTRHPVKVEQLPPDLREAAPVDDRGRVDRAPREFRAEVFRALPRGPRAAAGDGQARRHPAPVPALRRLQGPVGRLPRAGRSSSSTATGRSSSSGTGAGSTRRTAPRRSPSWRSSALSNVVVDAPEDGGEEPDPDGCRADEPAAYVRFHGRNAGTWNVRGGSASDRFDYLYSEEELEEWVEPLQELGTSGRRGRTSSSTTTAGARHASGEIAAQAPANAATLRRSLTFLGFPTAEEWSTVQVGGKIGRWDQGGQPARHTCALDRRARRGHHADCADALRAARRPPARQPSGAASRDGAGRRGSRRGSCSGSRSSAFSRTVPAPAPEETTEVAAVAAPAPAATPVSNVSSGGSSGGSWTSGSGSSGSGSSGSGSSGDGDGPSGSDPGRPGGGSSLGAPAAE